MEGGGVGERGRQVSGLGRAKAGWGGGESEEWRGWGEGWGAAGGETEARAAERGEHPLEHSTRGGHTHHAPILCSGGGSFTNVSPPERRMTRERFDSLPQCCCALPSPPN